MTADALNPFFRPSKWAIRSCTQSLPPHPPSVEWAGVLETPPGSAGRFEASESLAEVLVGGSCSVTSPRHVAKPPPGPEKVPQAEAELPFPFASPELSLPLLAPAEATATGSSSSCKPSSDLSCYGLNMETALSSQGSTRRREASAVDARFGFFVAMPQWGPLPALFRSYIDSPTRLAMQDGGLKTCCPD